MDINYKQRSNTLTLICTILALFIGATGMYLVIRYIPLDNTTITNINKTEKEVTVNEQGIADAVEKIYDAVVTVENHKNGKHVASGTGFVYKTQEGKAYVLTNNHVVENSDQVFLVFTDGKRIEAKLMGSDIYADIAVLQVDEKDIVSVAKTGSSDSARIGDTVFTVGAPLDSAYSWTVTRGILSGKDRMVEVSLSRSNSSDWIMKVLQTDASINNGNSGGPLANSNGEVIGINSLKLVSSGVEGMGFAIPIEDALEYAAKLEKGEKIIRPFLGVQMIELADTRSQQMSGISIPSTITSGVVIGDTTKGSPAEKGGLKKGDVVTEIEGKKCSTIAQLKYNLYKYKAGDTISLKVNSNGVEKTIKVKLVASE